MKVLDATHPEALIGPEDIAHTEHREVKGLVSLMVTAFLKHTQTRGHRADGGRAAHDVLAETHVDVRHREDDEDVHQRVVCGAHGLRVTEDIKDPAEKHHPVRIPPQACA